tara:strand:+ start:878 stop:2164 length:1287 start_codon:yes stop_codon:yes gene_type:complete
MVDEYEGENEIRSPRRTLGGGHWDMKLKQRMTALSNAEEYEDANKEWIVTDNVWYVPFGDDANAVLPTIHCDGPNTHAHECLCGHPIVWHFEIENTENGNRQIVGSEHIESYMVIRYFKKKGYSPETITEEMIEQWVTEKVKSLKADWWWDLHGEQFEEWFNEIKELDLRVNVRTTSKYTYRNDIRRNVQQTAIRKRAEGTFGQTGYKMASIVWRWNHPNNTRKQIESRGYPNERLWNDLQVFYITQQQYKDRIAAEDREIQQRLEQIAEMDRNREIERIEQAKRYAIRRKQMDEEQEERNAREAEREGIIEQQRLDRIIADRMNAEAENEKFAEMCEYYDIPIFTVNIASNDWERRFIQSITMTMVKGKPLSESQLNHLRKIVIDTPLPATEKQRWYIKKLAGEDFEIPKELTKTAASELITTLKGE